MQRNKDWLCVVPPTNFLQKSVDVGGPYLCGTHTLQNCLGGVGARQHLVRGRVWLAHELRQCG